MSDILSASKGIKALHEASEVIFIPATILALWSQASHLIVPEIGEVWALIAVCIVGLLGSIGLYQLISCLSPFFKTPPLFPALSVFMSGIGLIFIFQSYMLYQITNITVFTGFALIAWGFMLDVVHERVTKSEESHNKALKRIP